MMPFLFSWNEGSVSVKDGLLLHLRGEGLADYHNHMTMRGGGLDSLYQPWRTCIIDQEHVFLKL
jgi:hypothetical protein